MARVILKETKHWFIVLAENQYYLGKSFILLKSQKANLSELTREEFIDLKLVIDLMEEALQKAFGATQFNWTNGYYKKEDVKRPKELHLHVWPRYDHSVTVNGEVFTDEDFGNHYDKTRKKIVSEEFLEEIAKQIRTAMT